MVDVSIAGRAAPAGVAAIPDSQSNVLQRGVLAVDRGERRHGAGAAGAGAVERLSAHLSRHRRLPVAADRQARSAWAARRSTACSSMPASRPRSGRMSILQAALTAWLIVLTMRAQGLGGRPWLALGIVAMLTVCTSLPWFAGQLMPDILFPAAVLAIYLLAFQAAQLTWWERCGLAAVIVIAIPSHMAAAGLCVALIAALWLLARVAPHGAAEAAPAAGRRRGRRRRRVLSDLELRHHRHLRLHAGRLELPVRPPDRGRHRRPLSRRALPGSGAAAVRVQSRLAGRGRRVAVGRHAVLHARRLGRLRRRGARHHRRHPRALSAACMPRPRVAATLKQFVAFQTEISITDNEPTIATLADRTPQLFDAIHARAPAGRSFRRGAAQFPARAGRRPCDRRPWRSP